jgi:hypothetical protein
VIDPAAADPASLEADSAERIARAERAERGPGAPESRVQRMRRRGRERRRRAGRTNLGFVRFLRYMAVSEATAFLLLLTVGILHAVTGGWGTELFIIICHRKVGWGPVMLLLVVLAGFVPGGGLMVERWALSAPGRD